MKKLRWTILAALAFLGANPAPASAGGSKRIDDVYAAVVRVSHSNGVGTGFVAYDDGRNYWILTNSHVVGTCRKIQVEFFCDNRPFPVDGVVRANFFSSRPCDFAIVLTPKESIPFDVPVLKLGCRDARPGIDAQVVSAGCPNGRWVYGWAGFVNAYSRSVCEFTPVSIPGMSGSPLCEIQDGEVVVTGIVTYRLKYNDETGRDVSRGGAIPISHFYDALLRVEPTAHEQTGVPENAEPLAFTCDAPPSHIAAVAVMEDRSMKGDEYAFATPAGLDAALRSASVAFKPDAQPLVQDDSASQDVDAVSNPTEFITVNDFPIPALEESTAVVPDKIEEKNFSSSAQNEDGQTVGETLSESWSVERSDEREIVTTPSFTLRTDETKAEPTKDRNDLDCDGFLRFHLREGDVPPNAKASEEPSVPSKSNGGVLKKKYEEKKNDAFESASEMVDAKLEEIKASLIESCRAAALAFFWLTSGAILAASSVLFLFVRVVAPTLVWALNKLKTAVYNSIQSKISNNEVADDAAPQPAEKSVKKRTNGSNVKR